MKSIMKMEKRQKDLLDLQGYIERVDTDVTMILQHIQWDRSNLLQKELMVNCKYNANHRIPEKNKNAHEEQCLLKSNGYLKDEKFLTGASDINNGTLIKLGKNEIKHIIETAAKVDPTFKRGKECIEPLTIERLQATYTADERRAVYDAVVKAAPACHDLADLALLSENGEEHKNPKPKSRMEILAELRDMKRRRTKYRVAAKTRNYSDLLRDVIKTQMEIYTDVQVQENQSKTNIVGNKLGDKDTSESYRPSRDYSNSNANERSMDRHNKYNNSKDKYTRHYTDKGDSKIRNTKEQQQSNRYNSRDFEERSNRERQNKHHKMYIKEERDDEGEDKYFRKDLVGKEKRDKLDHTTGRDCSKSKRKKVYRDEDDSFNHARKYIKKEYDSDALTAGESSSYESKHFKHKSSNDDNSRHERRLGYKSRHDKPHREPDDKYDRYYNDYSRKDKYRFDNRK